MNPKDNLIELLRELFQLNNSDLDFGIYRILKLRSRDVEEFIEKVLPQKLEEVKKKLEDRAAEDIKKDLENVTTDLKANYGNDFELKTEALGQIELFKEKFGQYIILKERLENSRLSEDIENDIYNDLYRFFERYYEEGDFVTKPRAGDKTYMIPYDGEEVKLYWANYDQYYIKTGENFKNYVFTNGKEDDGKITVEFRLKDVETTVNNNQNEKGRLFIPTEDYFEWDEDAKKLNLFFYYKKPTDDDKENWGNKQSVKKDNKGINEQLVLRLEKKIKQTKNKELLEFYYKEREDKKLFYYHLNRYTALNKFDYFIHKDLKKFLTRELDYYLKNEILSISFLNPEWKDEDVEQGIKLNVVKASAIRELAYTIIEFLDELENFQKRLFEKKKFVVQNEYIMTLDMVPEEVLDDVINDILEDKEKKQINEWIELGYIKKEELDKEQLKESKKLVLDTKYLTQACKDALLNKLDQIENMSKGLLLNSENFQALELLKRKYKERIKSIYIDPPFNTGDDEFAYKDSYLHSSWISMLENGLRSAKKLLNEKGALFTHIDYKEISNLRKLGEEVFSSNNFIQLISIKAASPAGFKTVNPGPIDVTEYILFFVKDRSKYEFIKGYTAVDYDSNYNLVIENFEKDTKHWRLKSIIDVVYEMNGIKDNKDAKERWGDYWKIIRDNVIAKFAIENCERVVSVRDPQKPSEELKKLMQNSKSKNHPLVYKREGNGNGYAYKGGMLSFYSSKVKNIDGKETPTELLTDFWDDISWAGIANEGKVKLKNGKKPERLAERVIGLSSNNSEEIILDYFAGSGTTCAAAIKMNKKTIGVEVASYFNNLLLVRMKNVLAGDSSGISTNNNWKGGGIVNYVKLEQYEDTLNNIVFDENDLELEFEDKIKYRFRDGAENSASIMMVDKFEDPFNYKMEILQQNERKLQPVDLAATFNFLLGIDVERIKTEEHQNRTYRIITGKRKEQGYFIVWRKYDDKLKLDEERDWIKELDYYDENYKKYCNADNNFGAESTEAEFKRLMFEGVK